MSSPDLITLMEVCFHFGIRLDSSHLLDRSHISVSSAILPELLSNNRTDGPFLDLPKVVERFDE